MQRSLPAGWLAVAGREFNTLDRNERFPLLYIGLPFPALAYRGLRASAVEISCGASSNPGLAGRRPIAPAYVMASTGWHLPSSMKRWPTPSPERSAWT